MISVGCPNCGTFYQIPENALGDKGRNMRCKACGNSWFCTHEHVQTAQDPWEAPTPAQQQESKPALDRAVAVAKAAATELNDPFAEGDLETSQAGNRTVNSFKLRKDDEHAETLNDVEAEAEPLLAAERKKRQINLVKQFLKPDIIAYGLAAFIMLIFLLLPGTFVGMNPAYAKFYEGIGYTINMEGLAFDAVTTRIENEKGTTILLVEGDITNIIQESKSVPRIKLFVKNASGHDVYSWVISSPKSTLLSGETVHFKARYADPSPETAAIQIKFFNAKDLSSKPRA